MADYKPFLIADFKVGLDLEKEPWLLPHDAFADIKNGYIHRGVLCKRKGYTLAHDTQDTDIVTGIFMHVTETDNMVPIHLITTADRLYHVLPGITNATDLDGADTFTIDNHQQFQQIGDLSYMTNAYNRPKTFDYNAGTELTGWMDVDIDGGGNDLQKCKFLKYMKSRMILLDTTESNVRHPRRARWSKGGDVTDWTTDEFADADTPAVIRAADYLGNDIIVWFNRGVWALRYTGNSVLPFRWDRIEREIGSEGRLGIVTVENLQYCISFNSIAVTDGRRVDRKISKKLADFFTDETIGFDSGFTYYEKLNQIWIPYDWTSVTGGYSNTKMLVIGLDTFDISKHEFEDNINVLGNYYGDSGMPDNPKQDFRILGGSSAGKVFRMDNGEEDYGSNTIDFQAKTGRLNPFKQYGQKARLGYVDFLVETDDTTELSVDFYVDFNTTAYLTQTLDFDESGEKVWLRVDAGAIGESHQMKLYHDAKDQPVKIHAIMPWFKPAGRIN